MTYKVYIKGVATSGRFSQWTGKSHNSRTSALKEKQEAERRHKKYKKTLGNATVIIRKVGGKSRRRMSNIFDIP